MLKNMKKWLGWLMVPCLIVLFSGCKYLNPGVMLRTPYKYPFDEFPAIADSTYKIGPNDEVSFRLLSNDGEDLLKINTRMMGNETGMGVSGQAGGVGLTTVVEYDGMAKFPVLGRLNLTGYTKRRLEDSLEVWFSKYYQSPYATVRISNRRVYLFRGGVGSNVVNFRTEDMNLFEALASSGGTVGGKAHRIKLIRGDHKDPQVFLIDLSSINGMKSADLKLQSGDVIYVEPRENPVLLLAQNLEAYLLLIQMILGLTTFILVLK
jgi:polysaccharide export outer membrane protein